MKNTRTKKRKINVTVKYFGSIHERTDIEKETLKIYENTRIIDVLHQIVKKHGDKLERELFYRVKGKEKIGVLITMNGKLASLEEKLNDKDEIELIPLMTGG